MKTRRVLVDLVFDRACQWSFSQDHTHQSTKEACEDRLPCDRWQTSAQAGICC